MNSPFFRNLYAFMYSQVLLSASLSRVLFYLSVLSVYCSPANFSHQNALENNPERNPLHLTDKSKLDAINSSISK